MNSKTLIIASALSLLAIIAVGVAFSGLVNAQVTTPNAANPQGQTNGYCQNATNQNTGAHCAAQGTNINNCGGCGCGCRR
jgi:hypothetical protein